MTEIVHETWRPVVGWEGLYEVSDQGRVKSLAREDSQGRRVLEKILKPWQDRNGYRLVGLYRDGRPVVAGIHRLACEAFHGPAPAGKPFALHGNHDPADNRPENLRWGSPAENSQDMVDADRQAKGEVHGQAKITEADVKAILEELLAGVTQKQVAAIYRLAPSAISLIARGEIWSHVVNPELQARLAKRKRPKTLTDDEVLQVFDLAAQRLTQRKIGTRFDVSVTTISHILRGGTPRFRALRSQWLASRPGE